MNKKIENPIIDNRIVSDITFATRFKQFLEWIPKNWWMSQPHYYEEYEYMMYVANSLLEFQKNTCEKNEEKQYLKNVER